MLYIVNKKNNDLLENNKLMVYKQNEHMSYI